MCGYLFVTSRLRFHDKRSTIKMPNSISVTSISARQIAGQRSEEINGDTGPYTSTGIHAATATHCSSLPAALCLESGEPVGTAVERCCSCGRSSIEAAAAQATTSLLRSCSLTAGPESHWVDASPNDYRWSATANDASTPTRRLARRACLGASACSRCSFRTAYHECRAILLAAGRPL